MARLRHNDSIKAVGTTGKRSVMLALVVALELQEEKLRKLWKEFRAHNLADRFLDVLESVNVHRYKRSNNVQKDRIAENFELVIFGSTLE